MRRLAPVAILLLVLLPTTGQAQNPVQQTDEGVVLNFQNAQLTAVLTALGQAAGLNVVSSNIPEAAVTLRTTQPIPQDQVVVLLFELAQANGVTVIDQDSFLLLQGPRVQAGEIVEPRQLYIHRLEHARAIVLAGTLQALFGGSQNFAANQPQAPQTLSQRLQAIELQSAANAAGVGAALQGQGGFVQLGGGELEGDVQIVPDDVTNSLLIRATSADWEIIEQAIQALDLRPLHVVIEVIIAEVRRSDDLDLGVGFTVSDGDPAEGEGTSASLPIAEQAGAFNLNVLRTGDVDVDATLQALSSTGDVRILSRPVIQAQNNVEARILVGSERPFVQVSQTLSTDVGAFNQVVQYRDVGTALTILPTINEEGYVNMVLAQEVSSATAETQFGAPVISTREATTQILALSGQTVVIGGLVDQQTDRTRSGIPVLKDIPVLGLLFGTTRERVVNAELFLFLTPYVVSSDAEAERLRLEIEGRLELLRDLGPIDTMLPTIDTLLPPDTLGGTLLPPDTLGGGVPGR